LSYTITFYSIHRLDLVRSVEMEELLLEMPSPSNGASCSSEPSVAVLTNFLPELGEEEKEPFTDDESDGSSIEGETERRCHLPIRREPNGLCPIALAALRADVRRSKRKARNLRVTFDRYEYVYTYLKNRFESLAMHGKC